MLNKKTTIIFLFVLMCFFLIHDVDAEVSISGNGIDGGYGTSSGGESCSDGGVYNSISGIRVSVLKIEDGKSTRVGNTIDYYRNGKGYSTGRRTSDYYCSKIEYILNSCSSTTKPKLVKSTVLPNFMEKNSSVTELFNHLESNKYTNLKTYIKNSSYTCIESGITGISPCTKKEMENTYIIIDPMASFSDKNNTRYLNTAYEMKKIGVSCRLSQKWGRFASVMTANGTYFDTLELSNKVTSKSGTYYYNAVKNLASTNGIMIYSIADILEIPKEEQSLECGGDSIGCMSGYACYNDTIDQNSVTGNCITYVNINNKLGYDVFTSSSGRLILETTSAAEPAVEMTLTKKCAFEKDPGIQEINAGKYSNYLKEVSLKNQNLVLINEDSNLILKKTEDNTYIGEVTYEYGFSPIYSINGSGRITTNPCNVCRFLGYGLISNLNEVEGQQSLNFKFKFNNKVYESNSCEYESTSQLIVNNKLQLEFRTIGLSNPFPGKTDQFRTVGSNWCDDESCSGSSDENSTIKTVIAGRNNSFNQTGDGPKYKITLTPSTILKIREDNKNKSYEDFNFTCKNDGSFCISNYLTELRESYGLMIYSGSKKRLCVEEGKCE
ncbi:MAG: hypothetical protein IJE04_03440 [Bacilli bacterium]|nr:hypothetical protein [Bacilli bacterium]